MVRADPPSTSRERDMSRCPGTIDGRYLVVKFLDVHGQVRQGRGDQLGIDEIECPGDGHYGECPICGYLPEPWRRGDDPALAPCEVSE